MNKAPKLRFKEFSGDWESKKLGELGDVVTGNTPPTSDKDNYGNEYLWASPADLGSSKYIQNTVKKLSSKGFSKVRNVPKGSILVTCIGSTIGKIGIASEEMSSNQQINTLVCDKNLDNEFGYYSLNYNFPKYLSYATSQAVPIINKSQFQDFDIKVTSLKEQEKIASFFSLIDDKISLQGEKVEALKDYKKGMMQKIFSRELRFKDDEGRDYPEWEEKTLGEVSDVRDGTHDSPKYVDNGFRFITSKNLSRNGKIDFTDVNYISEEDYININKRSKVDIGDILFGMIGTIGNPVIVEKDGFAIKNVALIKEKEILLNEYLIQVLNSSIVNKQFHVLNAGGTQKFIALGVIRDLMIPVPVHEEQLKIINLLSNIDNKIDKEQEKLDSLNEYKRGLLQQMFI